MRKQRLTAWLLFLLMVLQMMTVFAVPASAASYINFTTPDVEETADPRTFEATVARSDFTRIRWSAVSGAACYRITVLNGRTNQLYNTRNEMISTRYYYIDDILAGLPIGSLLKVWVGAMSTTNAYNEADVIAYSILYIGVADVPAVTTYAAQGSTYQSVTLKMSVDYDNGLPITDCGFYFGTEKDPDDKYSFHDYDPSAAESKGTKTMTITGLKPETTYYFQAYAENDAGEIYTETAKKVTTSKCPHTDGTYDTATSMSVDPLDGTYHQRTIYYSYFCNYCDALVKKNAETTQKTEAHEFSAAGICKGPDGAGCGYAKECPHDNTTKEYYEPTYTSIDENEHRVRTRYYFLCDDCDEVIDGDRYYEYDEEAHTFRNNICKKCGYERAEELTLTLDLETTEATAGDTVAVTASAKGGSGGYQYAFTVYENGAEVSRSMFDTKGSFSYTPQQTGEFYFKVTVRDSAGNTVSVNSDTVTVRPGISLPPVVEDIVIYTPANGEWIDRQDPPALTWKAVDGAAGYWVSIYDGSGKCLSTTKTETEPLSLASLLPTASSTYTVRITAKDTVENLLGEGETCFHTNGEPPIVATGSAKELTSTSAKITFTVIRDGGSAVSDCGILFGTSADKLREVYHPDAFSGKGTYTVEVYGLEPGETYYYRAYAFNGFGDGFGDVIAYFTDDAGIPLTVSPAVLTFAGNGGTEEVSVNSEGLWEVAVTAGADWLTLDRRYGYGSRMLAVSAEENDTGAKRTGTMEITDETGTKTVTVTQNGEVTPAMTVNVKTVSAPSEKTVYDGITVRSNSAWTVTSGAGWIIPSVGSGSFDGSIALTIQANTTGDARSGTVEIACGSVVHTLTVTQDAPAKPVLLGAAASYEVTVGQSVYLGGVVSAVDGGKLNRITIRSVNTDQAVVSVLADGAGTYDLSLLAPLDTSAEPFSGVPGTYAFAVHASANNFTFSNNEIGRFSVTVKAVQKTDASVSLFGTDVTSTAATVKAQIDTLGGHTFEECGVILYDRSKTELKRVTYDEYPKNNSKIFSAVFSGLTPATEYFVRYYVKAGGSIFMSPDYTRLVTRGVALTDFTFGIENAYFSKADETIIATAGEAFTLTVLPAPSDAVIQSSKCTQREGGVSIIGAGNSYEITVSEAGVQYHIDFTVYGTDGAEYTKTVTVYAFGIATMEFQYNLFGEDKYVKVNYSDDFFSRDSYAGYSHDLAKLALSLCVAGYTANDSRDTQYYGEVDTEEGGKHYDDYLERIENISEAYRKLGIPDGDDSIRYYGYEESLNSKEHNVAHSIAKRKGTVNGEDCTILFVVLRGGGYGSEWASNFVVGNDVYSKAFDEAAWDVYFHVCDFILDLTPKERANMKILVTGFSRAAATANLTASRLVKHTSTHGCPAKDIYAYTFATPLTVKETYLNHDKMKYMPTAFDNIYNIINPGDAVPTVPLEEWGFTRYGQDCYFPAKGKIGNSYKHIYDKVNKTYKSLTGDDLDSKENVFINDMVDALGGLLSKIADDTEHYSLYYEELISMIVHAMPISYKTERASGVWLGVELEDYAREFYPSSYDYAFDVVGELCCNELTEHILWLIRTPEVKEILQTPEVRDMIKNVFAFSYLSSDRNGDVTRVVYEDIEDILSIHEILDTAVRVLPYISEIKTAVGTNGLLTSHSPALYMAWLRSFGGEDMLELYRKSNLTSKRIMAACPVDVYIYDQNGGIAAYAEGETAVSHTEDITIRMVDDVKLIEMPDTDDYRIEIIPKAKGRMDVTVSDVDLTGAETRKQYFRDVDLDTALEYELQRTVRMDGVTEYALVDTYLNTVSDASSEEGEIETVTVEVQSRGNGTASGGGSVSRGTYVTLTAVPAKNEAFMGWYLDETLISTSETYSFFAEEATLHTAVFTKNANVDEDVNGGDPEFLLGDITGDGSVDIGDSLALFRYSMLPDVYPIPYDGDVDFEKDGVIDIMDALRLFRYGMLPDVYPLF